MLPMSAIQYRIMKNFNTVLPVRTREPQVHKSTTISRWYAPTREERPDRNLFFWRSFSSDSLFSSHSSHLYPLIRTEISFKKMWKRSEKCAMWRKEERRGWASARESSPALTFLCEVHWWSSLTVKSIGITDGLANFTQLSSGVSRWRLSSILSFHHTISSSSLAPPMVKYQSTHSKNVTCTREERRGFQFTDERKKLSIASSSEKKISSDNGKEETTNSRIHVVSHLIFSHFPSSFSSFFYYFIEQDRHRQQSMLTGAGCRSCSKLSEDFIGAKLRGFSASPSWTGWASEVCVLCMYNSGPCRVISRKHDNLSSRVRALSRCQKVMNYFN